MVAYSQFSRREASTKTEKLWDPSETLGVINKDVKKPGITCVGNAPSQERRCEVAINKDNRKIIFDTLDDIAYLLPNSPEVPRRLKVIAGKALCLQQHQHQAGEVMTKWQRKLEQLRPVDKPKRTKPVQHSMEYDQTIRNLEKQVSGLRELLAKLQEEANKKDDDQTSEASQESVEKDRKEEEQRRQQMRQGREREARRQKREKMEKERLENERLEKERQEKEEKIRREKERAASAERIRQKAQKVREERAREKFEREKKEREEWDQSWTRYQEAWTTFKASTSKESITRDAIPWPVKSGLYCDVNASNVKEFLQNAVPRGANVANIMRKECSKWHPDRVHLLPGGAPVRDADKEVVEMIGKVVTGLLNECSARAADFLD